ncbi:MAG TPA: amino acid adenylation domain-containing protein, partial [Ktedonobacteraceae bacterium]|nr:amino acid adenylation domain-containing protein [Ktedonobacteraceae bacterium]
LDQEEHLLLLTLHHIITDGWSMAILLRELAHAYEAALGDTQPSWPPLPLQYADYALWQTHWLGEEALAHHLASWCQLLEGFPPLLDLPTDRPRPAVQSYWGASHAFILAPELTQKLVELSQNESVTLFMTLLATFGVVLARLSGQERLLIGSPIANRTQQQVEEIVGFFVNTLPFPLDLSGRPSFRQLLARVRQVALEAYAHQDVPFERLVEKFQPERSLSYAPLCQVFFALQNQLMEPQYLPGLPRSIGELRLEPSFQESGTAKFDLTLELTTSQQGLIGRLEYSQDLFEPETIQRLAECFQLVLTQIVAQPEQDVAHIQLLTEDERLLVLEQWNATDNNYEQEQCVHKMIEQQAQRAPEAIALVSQEHHLTYGALNARANQLAHYLRRLGVGPEILVGVCLQRSVEMIIGMLAILKAGGAYLPLDPDYPIERIEYMVRDAQVPLLLTTGSFSQSIEQHYSQPIHLVCLEREYEQKQLFRQSSSNLASVDYLENLAYVIYTSGSTGRPKGVQITHRGLCNLINWHQHNFVVTVLDRATQIASISFDAAVWETWPYLAAGATLYIVEDEMRTMPTTLSDCLAAQQITMCFLPTPLAEMLLDAHEPATSLSNTLRTLLVGGDVLHRPPDKELPFILVNNYGPTENTVVATSGVVLPTRERTGMPTIGYPIANTRLYVLDSLMQPVPIGATGELFIGGSSLARGYLRQPEMTAERFIPDPFGNQPGSRLYKTGDLVRYRANGSLDFIGRNDEQVKIRGFRVEPGEIEAILRQHESIREAAVIVLEDMPGEKRLIAYIVPEREGNLPPNQPGQYLRDRLPHYMIPARIVTLEQLPLSPNGKLDRRALPALNIDLSDLEKSYMPAHTPVEETLVSIWEKVLDVQRIGIYDNFFELGGHSLLATQVISHMRKAFQVDLPLQAIFDTPTIADLAQIIARMQEESPGAPSLQATSNVQAIPEGKEDAESLLARLDQLSTEEIDALLNAKFFERKGER